MNIGTRTRQGMSIQCYRGDDGSTPPFNPSPRMLR